MLVCRTTSLLSLMMSKELPLICCRTSFTLLATFETAYRDRLTEGDISSKGLDDAIHIASFDFKYHPASPSLFLFLFFFHSPTPRTGDQTAVPGQIIIIMSSRPGSSSIGRLCLPHPHDGQISEQFLRLTYQNLWTTISQGSIMNISIQTVLYGRSHTSIAPLVRQSSCDGNWTKGEEWIGETLTDVIDCNIFCLPSSTYVLLWYYFSC